MSKEELIRKQFRELQLEREQAVREVQGLCPHLAGSLSSIYSKLNIVYTDTCIVWHKLNDGCWVGICQECFRKFYPGEVDYGYWFNKKSISTRSESGYAITFPYTEEAWCSNDVWRERALQWSGLDKCPFDSNRFMYEWDSDCKKFHIKDVAK